MPANKIPSAAIFGCAGLTLSDEEKRFFQAVNPCGFILFARNVDNPDQVRTLVDDLRQVVGRHAPVLIDQEGGRVQRLRPPHWRAAPAGRAFADLYGRDPQAACQALYLNYRLIGAELAALGIDVDCAPVLDVPVPGAHDVIGDRAFGLQAGQVARLGQAVCDGLLDQGVLPVIKHIPGHGRAMVDSHHHLPVVTTDRQTLENVDFAPFAAHAGAAWAMTAHVVYTAIDDTLPATLSPRVIGEIIRGLIGFTGVLISDDLSMKALGGTFQDRTVQSLDAGCDMVLHCNGQMDEMRAVAQVVPPLSENSRAALARAEAQKRHDPVRDHAAELAQLTALLA